jgi:hypothetical protein
VSPPEVERAVVDAEHATYATLAGAGAWIYVLWLPLALFLAWMGIKRVEPLLAWVGFTVATAMAMLTARARGRHDASTFFVGLVLSSAAIAIASRVFGTLILTPTLLTMNAVGFAAAARRRWLAPTIAISLGFLIAPPALEAAGWIAATSRVDGGVLHVTSAVVSFREPAATITITGAAALFLDHGHGRGRPDPDPAVRADPAGRARGLAAPPARAADRALIALQSTRRRWLGRLLRGGGRLGLGVGVAVVVIGAVGDRHVGRGVLGPHHAARLAVLDQREDRGPRQDAAERHASEDQGAGDADVVDHQVGDRRAQVIAEAEDQLGVAGEAQRHRDPGLAGVEVHEDRPLGEEGLGDRALARAERRHRRRRGLDQGRQRRRVEGGALVGVDQPELGGGRDQLGRGLGQAKSGA